MATNYDYVAIVNAVNATVGGMYDYKFPIQENTDFKAMAAALLEAPGHIVNAYIDTMRNVIAKTITRGVYEPSNPFRRLYRKETGLAGDGDQYIYERAIDRFIPVAYDKTPDPEKFFKESPPKVKQQFLCNVLRKMYELSLNEDLLISAFDTDGGFEDFVMKVHARLYADMEEDDKEEIMAALDAVIEGGNMRLYPMTRPRDTSTAVEFSKALEILSVDLSFKLRRDFNLQHLSTKTTQSNVIMIVAADVIATQNNYNLAWAFNKQYLDLYRTGQAIEVDSQGLAGNRVFMVYTDTDFFRIHPVRGYPKMRNFDNGRTLSRNEWLHNWKMVNFSYFSNAIAFCEPGDIGVQSVEILDKKGDKSSTVKRGKWMQLDIPKVTPQPGKLADAFVNYVLTGNQDSDTMIGEDGTVYVGANETASELTITGTSHLDPSKSGTYTINVEA